MKKRNRMKKIKKLMKKGKFVMEKRKERIEKRKKPENTKLLKNGKQDVI